MPIVMPGDGAVEPSIVRRQSSALILMSLVRVILPPTSKTTVRGLHRAISGGCKDAFP